MRGGGRWAGVGGFCVFEVAGVGGVGECVSGEAQGEWDPVRNEADKEELLQVIQAHVTSPPLA